MRQAGFITETVAKTALVQPARAVKVAGTGSANYVADWIMDVLDDLVGRVEQDLVVQTSIDPALQAAAEKALTDELAQQGREVQCRPRRARRDDAARARCARWSAAGTTPKASSTAPSPPSASRARRSSRSSISPRSNAD